MLSTFEKLVKIFQSNRELISKLMTELELVGTSRQLHINKLDYDLNAFERDVKRFESIQKQVLDIVYGKDEQ
ncbi:uncharacterized protein ASCRUDRAFT_126913 [Ascoidea rubescens DSM 1968]|uniref:Uncharacterized protein n=1 Tax=Ascoidea rubescens DSM 1968 TaxID=1344418 RepID=A0A1D2VND5_9ASCO|nr:hypothetical protein ASCRUDRAFT_126913 [Ascoidea rubescens DSM 1968]ODV63065.1 hypothetical protein ASCRUDRAFT_126913 [Ascoidea rubescens DSM 1968]